MVNPRKIIQFVGDFRQEVLKRSTSVATVMLIITDMMNIQGFDYRKLRKGSKA
jgi:hypothetical protein